MRAFLQENIGIVLDDMGKPEEAMELHQEVLRVRVATLGPDHPDVADTQVPQIWHVLFLNHEFVCSEQHRPCARRARQAGRGTENASRGAQGPSGNTRP